MGGGGGTKGWQGDKCRGIHCVNTRRNTVAVSRYQRAEEGRGAGGRHWGSFELVENVPDVAGHDMRPAVALLSGRASCFTHDKSITGRVLVYEPRVLLELPLEKQRDNTRR